MKNRKSGFTIIEVVLVLAIAGLIFLMVFVALPALQRAQRDRQRRSDAGRFVSAIEKYIAMNNKLPFKADQTMDKNFVIRYIDNDCEVDELNTRVGFYYYKNCGEEFTSPDGTIYPIRISPGNTSYTTNSWWWSEENFVYFEAGAKCGDHEESSIATKNPKDFTVVIKLESGNNLYCVDNH